MTRSNSSDSQVRHVEWGKIAEYLIVFLLLPCLAFWYVGWHYYKVLSVAYYIIITMFVVQASMSYISTLASLPRLSFRFLGRDKRDTDKPIPRATFIVSAFLPNELDVVEATLTNLLENIERPDDGIEIILAYNTPTMLDIEKRLCDMALKWPELILANAYQSKSKVENLNYALELASGQIIGLMDADHLPAPDCLRKAWRWLATDTDIVQGRCKIRNGNTNILTSLIEVEFEIMYGMQHHAKSILFDTALFGGSDGFWRGDVLKKIRFRGDMLTEDIDATLRAVTAGHVIKHDRSIVSTELAPDTAGGFWFQRKRWSQGWFQCAWRHQIPVWRSPNMSLRAKFMWTWLLMWRLTYDAFAALLFPVLCAYWINRTKITLPINTYIVFAIAYTLGSGPVEAIASYKNALKPRYPICNVLLYALMAFPYTLYKNIIQMVAIRDHLLGHHDWIVTAHGNSEDKAEITK